MVKLIDTITDDEKDKQEERIKMRTHPLLKAKRPQQINAWIDANVTDMVSAKKVLKLLANQILFKD
jgi:hypothetical protein